MKTSKFIKLTGLSILLGSVISLSADEVSRTIELNMDSSNDLIFIQNLAGTIDVSPSKDDDLHIVGVVTADAKSDKQANELLNSIKFDTDELANRTVVSVVYPIDDYSGFIYNPNKSNSFWNNHSNNSSKYMGQRVRVSTKPRGLLGNWADVHVDLSIQIPADQLSRIKLVSGAITAQNLDNTLGLDTSSGKITVTDSQGELDADTGSGRVKIENFSGNVKADTGSGGVTLKNIKGDIDADTGSGGISINSVTGNVKADTGSGSVKVQDYLGGELLEIDTGSGSVRVEGDLGNLNKLDIDTGSGGVKLVTTHVPSLDIEIETGSGGINVDLPDAKVRRDKRGDYEATIGSGKGRAKIDTGSGGVSFRMDGSYKSSSTVQKPSKYSEKGDTDKYEGKNNPELAAKIRKALNKDKDIRNADIQISAVGNRAIITGTMGSVWDIAKTVKIVNEVKGVDRATINLEVEED